jgi:hypothetical protein
MIILYQYFILLWHIWLYLSIHKEIKNPAMMTQAGRHRIPKWNDVVESSFSWLSDWLCLTLYAQTGVQWLATPLSQPGPYWTRLQGVIKSLNSALHGIEPTTSRSSIRRLHPPIHGGCDNLSPNCGIYAPEHVKMSKELKFWNFKKLTPQGIEPRSAESSAVIIPLDHWFLPRNIRNEYINLIWHHLVSRRGEGMQ